MTYETKPEDMIGQRAMLHTGELTIPVRIVAEAHDVFTDHIDLAYEVTPIGGTGRVIAAAETLYLTRTIHQKFDWGSMRWCMEQKRK